MKEGWQLNKLEDVCEFENGDRGKNYPSKSFRTKSGIPFINAGHLTNKGLDLINMDYISRERFNLLSNGKLRKEDIVFCLRGSLGKFSNVGDLKEGAIASSLVIVRPNKYLLRDYLTAYFDSNLCSAMIQKFRNGAAQPNLSANSLKKFLIPIPPLPEQKRIVSILDDAFSAIAKAKANAEQNLKNSKELFESYLESVFDNLGKETKEKRIIEVSQVISGYSFDSKDFSSLNSIKSIKITNVGVKEFVEENDNYLPEKYQDSFKDFQVRTGNIVIALTRTIIAGGLKVAIVPESYNGALVNQRVAVLIPKENIINPRYLYNYLCSASVVKYVKSHVNTLMQPNLSINDLKNMPFHCPILSKQDSIVDKLNFLSSKTRKLEAIYKQKLNDLADLKKSILQKAFNGELNTIKKIAV